MIGLQRAQAPQEAVEEAVDTAVSLSRLVEEACSQEHARSLSHADDAEGFGLSSRPPSPLTPLPSEGESEEEAVDTAVSMSRLVEEACSQEHARSLSNADDAEGFGLSSRPPSPLTPLPSEGESEEEEPKPGPESLEKKRKRARRKERRRKKRQEQALAASHAPQNYAANPSVVAALTKGSEPIQLDVDASNLPRSSAGGAWVGRRQAGGRPWTPRELDEQGFSEIVWDGRRTRLILDSEKRIMCVLVARPQDPEWMAVVDDAAALMEGVRSSGLESNAFSSKSVDHRRGDFVALHVGVSFGGGPTVSAFSTSSCKRSVVQPRNQATSFTQRLPAA